MSKIIVTSMEFRGKRLQVCAIAEKNRILELRVEKKGSASILGNIYVGQVESINQNIQAAFVRFSEDQHGYFPLEESSLLIYASNSAHNSALRPGDCILVQVAREAMKGKLPYLTANLSFAGKYLVLTTGNKKLGVSKKLCGEERKRLLSWLEGETEDPENAFGIITRTNAGEAEKKEIFRELAYLKQLYRKVVIHGTMRSCYSLLYQPEKFYLSAIRDMPASDLKEILTDDACVEQEIKEYLHTCPMEEAMHVTLYQDPLLSLKKLYRLETALEEICQKKIWLKSGGFLVIEQTEAFVSIDVNTGKFTVQKKAEETYRRINLEAAEEIARQIRLRNLSGIILVDFINMDQEEHREELFHVLKKLVRQDSVKVTVVDITQLHILEMTRKKVRRPVIEELL